MRATSTGRSLKGTARDAVGGSGPVRGAPGRCSGSRQRVALSRESLQLPALGGGGRSSARLPPPPAQAPPLSPPLSFWLSSPPARPIRSPPPTRAGPLVWPAEAERDPSEPWRPPTRDKRDSWDALCFAPPSLPLLFRGHSGRRRPGRDSPPLPPGGEGKERAERLLRESASRGPCRRGSGLEEVEAEAEAEGSARHSREESVSPSSGGCGYSCVKAAAQRRALGLEGLLGHGEEIRTGRRQELHSVSVDHCVGT